MFIIRRGAIWNGLKPESGSCTTSPAMLSVASPTSMESPTFKLSSAIRRGASSTEPGCGFSPGGLVCSVPYIGYTSSTALTFASCGVSWAKVMVAKVSCSPTFRPRCRASSIHAFGTVRELCSDRSPAINSRLCWLSPFSIRSLILPSASTQATARLSASQTISSEGERHSRQNQRAIMPPPATVHSPGVNADRNAPPTAGHGLPESG